MKLATDALSEQWAEVDIALDMHSGLIIKASATGPKVSVYILHYLLHVFGGGLTAC